MSYISRNISVDLTKQIRQIMSSSTNFKAKKQLGQHFLVDTQICDEIALSCGKIKNGCVIEIGPGIGNLTQSILELQSDVNVIAIEKDERFAPILETIGKCYCDGTKHSRLKLIHDDALQVDLTSIVDMNRDRNIYIIANLPYNIGTELAFRWLKSSALRSITSINIMLQKEVINRMVAQPNTSAYCWLSIICQLCCECEVLFDVPADAFVPQPNVLSSFISLKPYRQAPYQYDIYNVEKICKIFFLHRRKTISRILKNCPQVSYLSPYIDDFGIKQNDRPENIDIETFCKLSSLSLNNHASSTAA